MEKLFSISEAAEMAGMTSETLRHYDRIGLVKPRRKDDWTGYRYYSRDDIIRLTTIQALRRMDLSLKEIRQILEYDTLEEIVGFLKKAEQKADDKILEMQYVKSKIQSARMDYEKKVCGKQETEEIFTKSIPARVILLSDTMESPSLNNLWNYHSHFYDQIDPPLRSSFAFEDLAGIYTQKESSRLFAVCIRYTDTERLKVLPGGLYLCAHCTEENRKEVLARMIETAKRQLKCLPEFTVQLIVVSGILQWNYEIQILLSKE
ncbi:MAG: MerR family transcriptional regulator [Clostridia bacterium]